MRVACRFTWLLAVVVAAAPSPALLRSGISIFVENDLLGNNEAPGLLALQDGLRFQAAREACESLGEALWSGEAESLKTALNTLQYRNSKLSSWWIASDAEKLRAVSPTGELVYPQDGDVLPAFCTQRAPLATEASQNTSESWRISVQANNENLVGYRDRNSFRFLGVRFAPMPPLLTYPVTYRGSGGQALALELPPRCIQADLGTQDCLFLNIWTPYLPKPSCNRESRNLKPVMFYIHGGGFLTGYGGDATFDGGSLASRGDVVVVTINYRLGALGWLALDDGVTNGNFGFADQVLALDWVREHIHAFGGDSERITIMGQSAGAASVRAMMVSPKTIGKFAAAVPLSYLGGLHWGTLFAKYHSIKEMMDIAGNAVLSATNCTNAPSRVDCLRQLSGVDLWWAGLDARLIVSDGDYILDGSDPPFPKEPLPVHVLMGIAAEDGTELINYPPPAEMMPGNNTWLTAQMNLPNLPPDLFPLPAVSNLTLAAYMMAAHVATDAMFRCVGQAAANAFLQKGSFGPQGKVYYYEFERTYQIPEWPPLEFCRAPPTPAHPNGDPESADGNLRCHTGEMLYVFGTLAHRGLPHRDDNDVLFERYVLDSFASFARTYDPNPERSFLQARGYNSTIELIDNAGIWEPMVQNNLQMRALDLPLQGDAMRGLKDMEQCDWMGLGLDYFLR